MTRIVTELRTYRPARLPFGLVVMVGLALSGCLPPGPTPSGTYSDGKGDNAAQSDDGAKTVTLRTFVWSFDISTYPVSISTCTHQGIGSRLTIRDQVEVVYRKTQRDGRIAITEISRTAKPALKSDILNRWYDHGRTVNYSNGCQDVAAEVVMAETLKSTISSSNESVVQAQANPNTVSDCIKAIPDGPCDSMGSCNYCLPDDAGVASCTESNDSSGGHNSNNDAAALRRWWDVCTDLDRPGGPQPDLSDLCVSPSGGNVAACHSTPDAESIHQQSRQCADDPTLYGTSNSNRCTGKQPICGPTAVIVCGLG